MMRQWRKGGTFVGRTVFENAKKHLEQNAASVPNASQLIEHCENHLEAFRQRQARRSYPVPTEVRNALVNFATVNPEKNIVYTANNARVNEDSPNLKYFERNANLKRETSGPVSTTSPDTTVNQAYTITDITRNFYQSNHSVNLNQLLGGTKEVPLTSIVHFSGKGGSSTGYDNAFWSPEDGVMVYGDGHFFNPLVSEPTVGIHEISHMFTQQTAGTALSGAPTGIDYTGDAGGINEANSDQAAVAAYQQSKGAKDPTDDNLFLIGLGLFRNDNPKFALRNMGNPGTAYTNSKYLGSDPQKGYGDYSLWKNHAADVDPHLSSAVGNKWYRRAALYCFQAGYGPTWQTVEKVRVAALPLCPPDVTYPQYAQITLKVAQQLYPKDPKFAAQIQKAWNDVKVI